MQCASTVSTAVVAALIAVVLFYVLWYAYLFARGSGSAAPPPAPGLKERLSGIA